MKIAPKFERDKLNAPEYSSGRLRPSAICVRMGSFAASARATVRSTIAGDTSVAVTFAPRADAAAASAPVPQPTSKRARPSSGAPNASAAASRSGSQNREVKGSMRDSYSSATASHSAWTEESAIASALLGCNTEGEASGAEGEASAHWDTIRAHCALAAERWTATITNIKIPSSKK
jgi:hypothetical protein